VAEEHFLTRGLIDTAGLGDSVTTSRDGALVTFTGHVRDHHDGRTVLWLEYEAHEEMAEKQIGVLVQDAQQRWSVGKIAIRHRLGRLDIGEVSVAIAVAAAHRAEALEACRWLIDTLKAEVPIFKKEAYAEGESWIEDSR
jgi:molybdopterin synthase catalytic subunit